MDIMVSAARELERLRLRYYELGVLIEHLEQGQ